jgi:hypothetical protein
MEKANASKLHEHEVFERFPKDALSLPLQDQNGSKVLFGALVERQAVVVVFIRHFN